MLQRAYANKTWFNNGMEGGKTSLTAEICLQLEWEAFQLSAISEVCDEKCGRGVVLFDGIWLPLFTFFVCFADIIPFSASQSL